jgi:hypothetical protein
MSKKYRISMQSIETYVVDAENEDKAYEKIAYGEVEPTDKEYYGDDIVEEIENGQD